MRNILRLACDDICLQHRRKELKILKELESFERCGIAVHLDEYKRLRQNMQFAQYLLNLQEYQAQISSNQEVSQELRFQERRY